MELNEGVGRIIKGYGGFYYISDGNILWECSLRGRFRKEKQSVLVGDKVRFLILNSELHKGVVEEILPRYNQLVRPPVANVDQALIVLSVEDPPPDLWLLDRLLIMIKHKKVEPILCWNKTDLTTQSNLSYLKNIYMKAGFKQIQTCTYTGEGVESVRESLKDKTTVFAGPSGVGKSSIINLVEPGLTLKIGSISDKLGRGKHTTRHVEWIPLSFGGWVFDTPGFSKIFLPENLRKENLIGYYEDFKHDIEPCRFQSCQHIKDKDCNVKRAVESGIIDNGRYKRYITFMEELKK